MASPKKNDFDNLINSIYQTHCVLQENAAKAVNHYLTVRNWLVGCYIVEYEQHGLDRAKYGTGLLDEMALKLKAKELKGFSVSALKNHRAFYSTYPQIRQSVIGELKTSDIQKIVPDIQKNKAVQLRIEKSGDALPPDLLLSRLTYTHFIELFRVEDTLQRLFYEVETIKNNWSVRELKRAIGTSLAFRTTMSTNKEAIIAKISNIKPVANAEVIRNPYILEFLDLEEKPEYSESDLEQSLLTHLQQFLIELGTGFCFEARQKRITFNNRHYRVDLVFYHRLLKCHILIDLKVGEFDHADAGQMTVYLNYFKKNEMAEGDNPPIGIILCANKDDALVEYASAGMDDQLFVSKYLVKLPKPKILENFIKREFNQ